MKFTCEKEKLLSAITITSRTVSQKSTIIALEGILIQAEEALSLTGYNMETGIRTKVQADIKERGSLVLSARLFLDIVRKLPNEEIQFSAKDYWVTITCGQTKFQIMGIDPEEFPDLPEVSRSQGLLISQSTLKSMINQTLFAVSNNESRPIHTGSLFEVGESGLTVVSVDGYRLALRREEVDEVLGEAPFSFVVPGSALHEVEKFCSGEDSVTVSLGQSHILFQAGETILVCRRLEGEFLVYRNAIPQENPIQIVGQTKELSAVIERVSLMINEKLKSPLKCVFEGDTVVMSSKTALGEAKDLCGIEGNGENLEIGFNNRYLMDALRVITDAKVRMEFSTPVSPCLILPEKPGDERFCYMVLPVRLKA